MPRDILIICFSELCLPVNECYVVLQVFFYSTGIFRNAGVPEATLQYAVVGTNAVNVLMTFIAVS